MKLLGEGLLVTVFAMGIVFVVLAVLMYVIKLETLIMNRPDKSKKEKNIEKNTEKSVTAEKAEEVTESIPAEQNDDGEIVAAIISAICASSGCSAENFKVKSIKRINSNYSEWRSAGIAERN